MTLSPGARLGPYEILSPLGAGGMGEVYRACDTRLERTVAIKVLSSHLSSSPEVRQRFEREAKAISQLSHPHICALYDVGIQDGVEFLVMEYLEGETLSYRLLKGPLAIEQVLRYGIEIADALDKAHRQGIAHRDLKPGNVMITKSGVKLLDFGLAKAIAPTSPQQLTSLPTQAPPVTREGTILGTFQYMSPEQLEGKEADARTDIFALGALLYEITTGRKAFSGKSLPSLISSIMKEEPTPIATLQPMTPPALDRVVRTCLAKDPEDRWQSAHDIAGELKWIAQERSQTGVAAPIAQRRKNRERLAWLAFGIAAAAALAFAAAYFRRVPKPAAALRASLILPEKMVLREMAISPDGRRLAFTVFKPGGHPALWVESLETGAAQPIAEAQDVYSPFWSPDGRTIAFFGDGKLKKVDASGGPILTICDAEPGGGGSWSRDGTIVFAPAPTTNLYRVAASGGRPSPVTKLDGSRHETAHRYPDFLPDGRHFLYMAANLGGPPDDPANGIRVGALDGSTDKLLLAGLSNPVVVSGHLLFVREGTLLSQPIDLKRLEVTGQPFPLAQRVGLKSESWYQFTASEAGILIYAPAFFSASRLLWFDRTGKLGGSVGEPALYGSPRLSPDGRRLAVEILDAVRNASDIWIYDLSGGTATKFVFGGGNGSPVWSPDGSRLVFATDRRAQSVRPEIWIKPLNGGAEKILIESLDQNFPDDWSSDGRFLSFSTAHLRGNRNLEVWAADLGEKNRLSPIAPESPGGQHSCFSPDARWIAYDSWESGRPEVYVRPFPGPGGKWQISSAGGGFPRWRRDGKELFYLTREFKIMSVSMTTGGELHTGSPVPLFGVHPSWAGEPSGFYDVTADGSRFLVNSAPEDQGSPPLTVLENWTALLRKWE